MGPISMRSPRLSMGRPMPTTRTATRSTGSSSWMEEPHRRECLASPSARARASSGTTQAGETHCPERGRSSTTQALRSLMLRPNEPARRSSGPASTRGWKAERSRQRPRHPRQGRSLPGRPSGSAWASPIRSSLAASSILSAKACSMWWMPRRARSLQASAYPRRPATSAAPSMRRAS